MAGTLVVIPTYNERENIAAMVARVRAAVPEVSVLVVDDSSPDGTGVLADELAAVDPAVHVLHRTAKDGLGAAYLEAFGWAIDQGYDPIVQLDADGSHLPEQLPRLLEGLEGADAAGRRVDLVIGSRWVPGGSIENWPRHRELLSRWGSAYARTLLRLTRATRPPATGRSGPTRCVASGSRTCTRAATASRWTCSGTRARPAWSSSRCPSPSSSACTGGRR